jgi:hypothetical protein
MLEMSEFIRVANREVFNPQGLVLINPLDRGVRLIEVVEAAGAANTDDAQGGKGMLIAQV